jgi:site-specific recombinase XerD
MSDFLTQFAASLASEEAAKNTIDSYLLDLQSFAQWFATTNGEELTLQGVTPTDVREYKAHMLTVDRAKPATVNRHLAAVRKLCRWAKGQGLISENPAEDVKGVERVRMAPKALSKREVDRLTRFVEREGNKRDLAIIQILHHTGIRVGELVALRVIDLEIGERKGKLTVRWGKGGKYREVPLNNDARKAMTAYLAVRPQGSDDHVFIGQRSNGLTVSAVQDVVEKYSQLAGLEGVTPHVLRHTFGKQTLDAGENLVTVATLMGHSRLDTTAIYTQPNQQDLERAVERLATK